MKITRYKKWKLAFLLLFLSSVLAGCSTNKLPSYAETKGEKNTGAATVSGRAVFSNPNELNQLAPTEDYKLGIHDLLEVSVFQLKELSRTVRVDSRGNISLPLLGTVQAKGLTSVELEEKLADALREDYLQNPQVSVFITEYTSQQITVSGQVGAPNVFPIKGKTTLSQAIAMAQGLNRVADPEKVVLFRQKEGEQMKAYQLNLASIQEGAVMDPYLRGNDRIVVHRSGSKGWIRDVMEFILRPASLLR